MFEKSGAEKQEGFLICSVFKVYYCYMLYFATLFLATIRMLNKVLISEGKSVQGKPEIVIFATSAQHRQFKQRNYFRIMPAD